MKNRELFKLLCGALLSGFVSSCMGLEETGPVKNTIPQVKSFDVSYLVDNDYELSAKVADIDVTSVTDCGFYISSYKSMQEAERIESKMLGQFFYADITVEHEIGNLYVCAYIKTSTTQMEICSDVKCIPPVSVNYEGVVDFGEIYVLSYDTNTKSAILEASYTLSSEYDVITYGLCYASSSKVSRHDYFIERGKREDAVVSFEISDFDPKQKYYVRPYVLIGDISIYGQPVLKDMSKSDSGNLSNNATANCYIVSKAGTYSFPTVKGNSDESVGNVEDVEVLWESFGTSIKICSGDLISNVSYENGNVVFTTADPFREGNAVIAVRDKNYNILWSWHIWITDMPELCHYTNVEKAMMDRNLGATSANKGDVCALGLLYQWGRKDPFLGSSDIDSYEVVQSTASFTYTSSSTTFGTIAYSIANPTTFIKSNDLNDDWYCSGSSDTDHTRWQSEKTIYDPCPAGWRVPDGGANGVWAKAEFGSQSYDGWNEGMLFESNVSSPSSWYPAAGYISSSGGHSGLSYSVHDGRYWSVTRKSSTDSYCLYFDDDGEVYTTWYSSYHACANSVRCIQE